MALTFPDTPTVGQEVYSDTKKYTWDGVKWKLSPIAVDWVRPTDWLTMPTVLATEQKFVGLHAVFPNDSLVDSSNYVALMCYGNYTVDWGDGVIENFNQAITAYHIYDYNTIPSNTYCSRGYRQVLVTVTPQSGLIFTNLSLQNRHFRVGLNGSTGWLDMTISMPQSTGYCSVGGATISHDYLEQVKIITLGNITSLSGIFAYSRSLVSTPFFDTSKITSITTMYRENRAIRIIPAFDFSLVTDASNFAINAVSLVTIGAIKTSSLLTNASQMFNACNNLVNVPLFNTGNVQNASGMFGSCFNLVSLPEFNFSNVTNASSMFTSCSLLRTIQLFNFSNVQNASSMFSYCYELQSVPAFNFNNVTSALNMFQNCTALISFPAFNFSNVTTGNFNNAFAFCSSLIKSDVTGVKFTHSYNSDKLSPNAITTIMNNLPILPTFAVSFAGTGVQATSIVTAIAHGLLNTTPIKFIVINNTTGITATTTYYVINATTDTFQVSLTSGGVAVILSTNGTGTCSLSSTITIVNNWGSAITFTNSSFTTTAGSKVITLGSGLLSTVRFLAGNIITMVNGAPGWFLNQKFSFRNTGTSGLAINTPYYIVKILTTTEFQISLQANGTPATFPSGGTDAQALLLSLDSQVTGTGSPLTTPIVMAFTANKVVLTNHQLQTNDIVSFPVITNNLATYTPYYIVGTPNANDFQISTTLGGTAITFTDGTGTMLYDSVLESVSGTAYPFTFNMSRPMTATTSANTMVFRSTKTSIALFKNWTVA